ncbi:MAG: hypothetical protein B7X97_06360, partial [Methylotenera sp. 17-45-7]
ADGSPILKLSSAQPVSDPYLDMLIQVDWSSGRLLREYTILLDPPEYKQAIKEATVTPAIINKPTASASNGTYAAPSPSNQTDTSANSQLASKSKKSKPSAKKVIEPDVSPETVAEAEATQVTTQRGDSLGAIAKEVKLDGVSLDQMLLGLFEANKQAFVDGNMNRLKVGQILKVPSKDEIAAIDSKQATKEVKLHSANWNAYRNSLAGNVIASEVTEQSEVKQSASGKISTAEDHAAVSKTGPQDVVKLSAGGKGAKADSATDSKVLALQEEATAKEKALKEAQERTSALEAQIADMQKLLALKNQAMANAQKSAELQAAANTATKPVDVKPETAKPVEPQPAQPKVAELKATEPATVADAQPNAEISLPSPAPAPVVAAAPTQPAVADNQAVSKPKPPKPVVSPAPEEEQSLLDSILAAVDLMMLAAAAGIALLAAGWAYLRNKRRRDLDSFERGILTSGGLSANTVFGNTTSNASTSDTSFLTDFAQSADGSMIDTNDVDPIAEAEVYMAYGRDAQAEEILKDAIVKEPKRYELHLKLLEMYAGRKDISAFEAIAGELYTTLGSDNPTWAKVAELGATVEPDNPLYDLSRLPTAAADTASNDNVTSSLGDDINKELDWEKGLDLDKELEFSSGLPNIENASVVVNDTSNNDVVLEQTIDTSEPQFSEPQFNDALNDEMALFGASETLPESVPASVETTTPALEEKSDNSLNFDFSELGSFALDSATPDAASVDASATAPAENVMEFASALELPQASADNEQMSSFVDEMAALPDSESVALDFNFEGLGQDATPEVTETAPEVSFADFNLELPEQAAIKPQENPVQENPVQESLEIPVFAGIDLSFGDNDTQDNSQVDEIKFDLPQIEETPDSAAKQEPVVANNFDFSSISLDLSDTTESIAAPDTTQADALPSISNDFAMADEVSTQPTTLDVDQENENPDVDIKLDLVKVYIDMDDIEGARELLDEVVKEGGPKQRQSAEKLLTSLA